MARSKKDKSPLWIAESRETKRIQTYLQESIEAYYPIILTGDTGVGKSFWLDQLESLFWESNSSVDLFSFHMPDIALSRWEIWKRKKKKNPIRLEGLSKAPIKFLTELKIIFDQKKYDSDGNLSILWEVSRTDQKEMTQSSELSNLFEELRPYHFEIPNWKQRKEEHNIILQTFLKEISLNLNQKIKNYDIHFYQFISKKQFSNNLQGIKEFLQVMVSLCKFSELRGKDIPSSLFTNTSESLDILPGLQMNIYEREIVRKNLLYFNGNRERTAKSLGISERNLYRKIKQYQLEDLS